MKVSRHRWNEREGGDGCLNTEYSKKPVQNMRTQCLSEAQGLIDVEGLSEHSTKYGSMLVARVKVHKSEHTGRLKSISKHVGREGARA